MCNKLHYNRIRLAKLSQELLRESNKTKEHLNTWKIMVETLHCTDPFPERRIFCILLEFDRADVEYQQGKRLL